jgi:hypothetical protein
MLDCCLAYKEAFGYYYEVDNNYEWQPSPTQWKLFYSVKPILGTMSEATSAFSASTYPTANVFFPYILQVKMALKEAQKSGNAYMISMADAMLEKFYKYWEVRNVMAIATILDPRFKMRYIRSAFGNIYNSLRFRKEISDIEEELESLYQKYESIHRPKMGETTQNNTQSASSSKDTSSSLASIVPSEFQSFLESTATETSKSELLMYLDEPNISISDDKKFDLLNFWKVNAHRFPVVSNMSKRFSAIQADLFQWR